jgi:hypothetical protein
MYEQVLKLYVASSVIHYLYKKEVMLQRVPKKAYLFYILNMSPRIGMPYYKEGQEMYLPRVEHVLRLSKQNL